MHSARTRGAAGSDGLNRSFNFHAEQDLLFPENYCLEYRGMLQAGLLSIPVPCEGRRAAWVSWKGRISV